jgi:hypothetical protein
MLKRIAPSLWKALPVIFALCLFVLPARPAQAGSAPSSDVLVQCDRSGTVLSNTVIGSVYLPIQPDSSGSFYLVSVDAAIFAGSGGSFDTFVTEQDGFTSTGLQIGLGAVTSYDTGTLYEIKYRGHYGVVGEEDTQGITEDWQDSGLYFEAEVSAPSAPTNLSATPGDGQVTLDWSAVTNATSYAVYDGTSSGGESASPVATVSAPSTSCIVTGLTNGTPYYFVVKASNAGGDSAVSNEAHATPEHTAQGNSSIHPTTATFDLNPKGADHTGVPVTVTPNGNTLSSITNGSYTLTSTGTNPDCTVSGDVYTITTSYMDTLSASATPVDLTFNFSGGNPATLAVFVEETTPTGGGGLTFNPASGSTVTTSTLITISASPALSTDEAVYWNTAGFPLTTGDQLYQAPGFVLSASGTVYAAVYDSATGSWSDQSSAVYTVGTAVVNSGGGSTPVLAITTTSLPAGAVGQQYNQTITTNNEGTAPYTFSVTSGSPPGGVTLDATTGLISGTPTTAGTYTFTVTVKDANNNLASEKYTLTVKGPALAITTTSLAAGTVGHGYSQAIGTNNGGATPYTFAVTSGNLPPGLALDASAGVISGTPTTAGTYNFTVTVQDANNNSASESYSLAVGAVTPPATPKVPLSDIGGSWAKASVEKLLVMGVVMGYPDGTFRPNNYITRAEFATMLVKALKLTPKAGHVFPDTEGSWAKAYISTAAAYGIVKGYDAAHFGPDDLITREQMTAMLVRAAKLAPVTGTLSFADAALIDPWAREDVITAVKDGIIHGYPDRTFRPHGYATRAEAVTVIAGLLK